MAEGRPIQPELVRRHRARDTRVRNSSNPRLLARCVVRTRSRNEEEVRKLAAVVAALALAVLVPRSARTATRMGRRVRARPRASRARVRRRLPRTPTARKCAFQKSPGPVAASQTRRTGVAPRRAALRARSQPRTDRSTPIRATIAADRARRGGSGVLYSQSALARPNPRPRDAVFEASTPPPGVDGQVPRGGRS